MDNTYQITHDTRVQLQEQAAKLNQIESDLLKTKLGKQFSEERESFGASIDALLDAGAVADDIRDILRATGEDKAAFRKLNKVITARNKEAGKVGESGGGGGPTEAIEQTQEATEETTSEVEEVEGKPLKIRGRKAISTASGSLFNSKLIKAGSEDASVIDVESTGEETYEQREAIRGIVQSVGRKLARDGADAIMIALYGEATVDADSKQRAKAAKAAKAAEAAKAKAKAAAAAKAKASNAKASNAKPSKSNRIANADKKAMANAG